MEFHATPPLRFAVGDRVRCKTGARSWKRGSIVALHYREESWPQGEVAPYQIQLDAGVLIFAPEDSDCLIQADDGMAEEADCGTMARLLVQTEFLSQARKELERAVATRVAGMDDPR